MRTLLRPRRLLMWSLVGRRRGSMALGSLGGSRRLAGGTWTGTLLFCGTLLGDVAAAAGSGACVQFLDFVVVVPVVQVVLRAGGSGPWLQLFDQRDVLGGVLVAEGRGGGRRF